MVIMSSRLNAVGLSERTRAQCSASVKHLGCKRLGCGLRRLFHPYRPEFHYMRGPAPKWRAKYGERRTAAVGGGMDAARRWRGHRDHGRVYLDNLRTHQ